ncbi:MAG: restriction endonuclease [Anaerolineales bacterium]|nr:restriction endonuclease [Anaerolineales bacterium]
MVRTRRKHNAPKGSTREKGDVLEQIIAEMHNLPGVKVERNIFLPTLDKSGRTREIDVLITGQVAGFPVRIAIECKNEKDSTGIAKIGEFIDKLNDVGLPVQLGIFVSTSRYESGAIERAKNMGLRTLLLKDVTSKLTSEVKKAYQSLIYLQATIATVNVSVANESDEPSLFFFDEKGKIRGSIGDLAWDAWLKGKIPYTLGTHEINLDLPKDWKQIHNEREIIFTKIKVSVLVTGYIITVEGKLKQYNLVDVNNETIEKWQVKAQFPPPFGKHVVTEFHTEEDLDRYLVTRGGLTIVSGRLKLPKVRWASFYWPPSLKALDNFQKALENAIAQGKTIDWITFPFNEIEGTDLSAAYDPIWEGHPYEPDRPQE